MNGYEPTDGLCARAAGAHGGLEHRRVLQSAEVGALDGGTCPDYRALPRDVHLTDGIKLQKYAAHLRSSQVFALNLILPFREGCRSSLSECVSRILGIELLADRTPD